MVEYKDLLNWYRNILYIKYRIELLQKVFLMKIIKREKKKMSTCSKFCWDLIPAMFQNFCQIDFDFSQYPHWQLLMEHSIEKLTKFVLLNLQFSV